MGLFCYYREYFDSPNHVTKEFKIIEFMSKKDDNEFSREITVNMTPYLSAKDSAKIIHCAEKYGLLFVMTKLGFLYVYEMTSGVLVYWHKVVAAEGMRIEQWCRNCATDGIVILLNNGDLIHIDVAEDKILDFILQTPQICPDNIKLYVDLALQFRT